MEEKMGRYHIDPSCERALIGLNDELCTFERNTGREYLLILVPLVSDEPIHISQNGKPLPPDFASEAEMLLHNALIRRGQNENG